MSYEELLNAIAEMDDEVLKKEQWKLHSDIAKVKETIRAIFDGMAQLGGFYLSFALTLTPTLLQPRHHPTTSSI